MPKSIAKYVEKAQGRVFEDPKSLGALSVIESSKPKVPAKKKAAPGRPTNEVQDAMLKAFVDLGGVPALVSWAAENQTDFYKLWARILPHEIRAGMQKVAKSTQSHVQIEFVTKDAASAARVTINGNAAGEIEGASESMDDSDASLESEDEIVIEPISVTQDS